MHRHVNIRILVEIFFCLTHGSLCYKTRHVLTKNNSLQGKIIGGQPVPLEQFPFLVQFFNFGALCAGTILNSWSVLTAAHCFDLNRDKYDMMIQVGARYTYDNDADIYDVVHYIIHENYNKSKAFACDVALLFVDQPIRFGNKSKKALIVDSNEWMKNGTRNFVVTGWGWTKYPGGPVSQLGLMMTQLHFVTTEQCNRLHRMNLTEDMFCLYGGGVRDSCKGDSGGGVLWNGMIVGIVSHGAGCARKNKPSVYSNVWYFKKWIETKVGQFFVNYCTHNNITSPRRIL